MRCARYPCLCLIGDCVTVCVLWRTHQPTHGGPHLHVFNWYCVGNCVGVGVFVYRAP